MIDDDADHPTDAQREESDESAAATSAESTGAASSDPFDALLAQLAEAPEQQVDPSPLRHLESGERIGRYQVVRELGRGGFGVVYEARDGDLGRHVALKALRPDRLGRRGKNGESQRALRLSLLQQEAEMVARLQHPNIVTLFDLVIQDGLPFLVLELLSGENLQSALTRGPLAPDAVIDIGVQIARGLAHAHAAGVIHRDLKPSNVFRTHDGLVKLLDLGLARGLAGDALLPRAGTPGFMAPEQWRGAEDARSDVYGVGLLLHALLGGRVPHAFTGTGSQAASELFSSTGQPHPGHHVHALLEVPRSAPTELSLLIQRTCSADPALRPQSARALLDELLLLQRGPNSSPLFLDGPSAPLTQPQRKPGAARLTMLAIVLGAICWLPWLATRKSAPDAAARTPASAHVADVPDTFREVQTMSWSRAGATATVLRTGAVLVAGGADETGPLAHAELFEPNADAGTGAFRGTAPLANARQGATATLLGDGRAVVVGGEGHSGSVAQLELYDPAGNSGHGAFWSGPLLHTARSGHCAARLTDGRVLLVGGEHDGKPLADAELFDPRAAAADGALGVLLGPFALSAARTHPACALLPDGRVLVTGGLSSSGALLASAEIFDPAEGQAGAFVTTGALATARAFASMVRLDDGRVFVAGGLGFEGETKQGTGASVHALNSVEQFDPLANSGHGAFTPAPPLLTPRSAAATVALANGSVLFAGGIGDNDNRLAAAELYSPDASPAARPASNLSTPRGNAVAALLADGRAFIAGGDQRTGRSVASAELFTPRGVSRTAIAASTTPLREARAFASVIRMGDGSVLIAGGRAGTTLSSIERFEPRTREFTLAGQMQGPRTGASAVLLGSGDALLAGGLDGSGAPVASAEILSLQSGAVRSQLAAPLVAARAFAGVVRLPDGRTLIVGGSGSEGGALASAELFDSTFKENGRRGRFVSTAPMSSPRSEPMISLLPDGRVLVAGGLALNGSPLATAEIFDPAGNGGQGLFRATGSMAQGRSRAAIALLPNGRVLVGGGLGQAALASAELFDPQADSGRGAFVPTGGLNSARQRACVQRLASGLVLLVGGADAEGGALASAELFDPQGEDGIGSFAPAAGLSIGREIPLCARLADGHILVAGGRNNGVLASAEIWSLE